MRKIKRTELRKFLDTYQKMTSAEKEEFADMNGLFPEVLEDWLLINCFEVEVLSISQCISLKKEIISADDSLIQQIEKINACSISEVIKELDKKIKSHQKKASYSRRCREEYQHLFGNSIEDELIVFKDNKIYKYNILEEHRRMKQVKKSLEKEFGESIYVEMDIISELRIMD